MNFFDQINAQKAVDRFYFKQFRWIVASFCDHTAIWETFVLEIHTYVFFKLNIQYISFHLMFSRLFMTGFISKTELSTLILHSDIK